MKCRTNIKNLFFDTVSPKPYYERVLKSVVVACAAACCTKFDVRMDLILAYNLVWQPFEWKFANFVTKLNWVMKKQTFENFQFVVYYSLNWLPFKLSKHRKKRQFSQVFFLSVTNLRIYFWGQRFWTQKCFLYLLALRAFNFGKWGLSWNFLFHLKRGLLSRILIFLEISHLPMSQIPKIQNSELLKWLEWQFWPSKIS